MTDADYRSVDGVVVALEGGVLRLTLDRPERRNALDDTMMVGLIDALDQAGRDEAVRAVVLAGAGDHFCGGADIVARNRRGRTAPPSGPGWAASNGGCRRPPTGSSRC